MPSEVTAGSAVQVAAHGLAALASTERVVTVEDAAVPERVKMGLIPVVTERDLALSPGPPAALVDPRGAGKATAIYAWFRSWSWTLVGCSSATSMLGSLLRPRSAHSWHGMPQ